ncbi:MAG TPA: aldolase/citrate lyase family protein [Spirochaetia bacterium]|nr:aldolase/citrate lyase family protein [Spirochaetia bacterium]
MRTLLEKLREGRILLGICVMYPVAGIVERIGPDWDFVWIDSQHGQHDYHSLLESVRAADFRGVESLIRVPGHDAGSIGRALDMGASGVLVPQVDTREQAESVIRASKFPPTGNRSFGGRRPVDVYGRSYSHTANRDVALVVQIESQAAVENAEAILSLDGIDAFFFGPDDMALRDGLPMDQPRPAGLYDESLKRMIEIGKRYSVFGGGVFASPEAFQKAVELGFSLISVGGDAGFLAEGSQKSSEKMRALLKAGTGKR